MAEETLAGYRLVPIIPDGGWGWVVTIGSFFIHVFSDGFVYSLGVLADVLMKEFKSDNTSISLIISLLPGITLCAGPVASTVCNNYGCRVTAIIGSCIAIMGCALSLLATAMWHMVISVGIVMGIGFGFMYCPAIVAVTTYFEKRRSLATGIAISGAGIGTVIFSPINDFIITNYGWKAVFFTFLEICILDEELNNYGVVYMEEWMSFIQKDDCKHHENNQCYPSFALEHMPNVPRSFWKEAVTFLLSVVCAWTFRPLSFQKVPISEEANYELVRRSKTLENEKSAALVLDNTDKLCNDTFDEFRFQRDVSASEEKEGEHRRHSTPGRKDIECLEKKDVFYVAPIADVTEFTGNLDKYRATAGSSHGITIGLAGIEAERGNNAKDPRSAPNDFSPVVKERSILASVNKMLSLSLLLDPVFLIYAISNFLTSVGFSSPIYFLPLQATRGLGLDSSSASKILAVYGFCNTIGRLVFGIVADHKFPLPYGLGQDVARNRLWMFGISLTICGALTTSCYLYRSLISLSIYAALFGFFIASYICLTSVILVDLLGLEKLTCAFGLLLLWEGIGSLLGPPIAGCLADFFSTYTWTFVFCGIDILVSGLIIYAIPYFQKRQALKPREED